MTTAPVTYVSNFLNVEEASQCFNILWAELAWERREGAPRREYWTNTLGRDYTYGRGAGIRTYKSQETHPVIETVTDRLAGALGFRYEGCFLNGYENSRDWLGFHADDDPGINHERPIAVITIGAGRNIQFKSNVPGSHPESQFLEPGSLLLMQAGMQSTHLHSIPKVGHDVGPRISLTYRSLL